MDIRLRKNQNTLVVSGLGLVVLCLWDLIKMIIHVIIDDIGLKETFQEAMQDISDLEESEQHIIVNIFNIAFLLVIVIFISVYFYAGISAYNEGIGKKKGNLYILLLILLLYWEFVDVKTDIETLISGEGYDNTYIPTLIIDITSLLFVLDILVAVISSRLITRKMNTESLQAEVDQPIIIDKIDNTR